MKKENISKSLLEGIKMSWKIVLKGKVERKFKPWVEVEREDRNKLINVKSLKVFSR